MNVSALSSTELVEYRPAMDTAAIFREHAPFVWRVLRRLGVAESDVSDVCQEVFMVVHRKLSAFEGRSQIRTWVYGICVHTASDYRKRAHRRKEFPTDALPDEASQDLPVDRQMEVGQARRLLDQILDSLDEDKRAVFVLFEIEQLTMNDVAAALSCPVQTAYSRLHAARALVAQEIQRFHEAKGDRS